MASSNTARGLIKGAVRLIKGASYRASNSELGTGLSALNDLLVSWSADQISVPVVISESFPLVVGQVSYTIGSGGDIDTVRPTEIKKGVYVRDSIGLDHPITIMTRERYNAIYDKDVITRPTKLYYEPSYPLATIFFNFAPQNIETVYFDSLKPLTEIPNASVDTVLALPPEYQQALRFNLAVVLAPEYADIKLPSFVVNTAKESKDAVERVNSLSLEETTFDPILLRRKNYATKSSFESGY